MIKYYIGLIIFIFILPYEIGGENLLWLKIVLFILFFVGPVLKFFNRFGEPIDKKIKDFKKFDDWKNDKFKGGF